MKPQVLVLMGGVLSVNADGDGTLVARDDEAQLLHAIKIDRSELAEIRDFLTRILNSD